MAGNERMGYLLAAGGVLIAGFHLVCVITKPSSPATTSQDILEELDAKPIIKTLVSGGLGFKLRV